MKLMSVLTLLLFSTIAFSSGSNTVFIERYDIEKVFKIPDSGVVHEVWRSTFGSVCLSKAFVVGIGASGHRQDVDYSWQDG